MKSKFLILSVLFHVLIFIGFSKFSNNNLKLGKKIPDINLTLTTLEVNYKPIDKVTTKNKDNRVTKSKEIEKTEPKKKQKPKKQVVQKKIEVVEEKPKIVQSKKTKLKKVVESIDPSYTESNKNIEKNNNDVEVVQNTPTNDAVLEDEENDKNLIKIHNGRYALKNQKVSGVHIVINKEILPTYPNLALKMGYKKETIVKVKFLVNKKGKVGDIKFYTNSKYGFENEVEKALKQWVFEPVIYRDRPMPLYFYKVFHFVSKG